MVSPHPLLVRPVSGVEIRPVDPELAGTNLHHLFGKAADPAEVQPDRTRPAKPRAEFRQGPAKFDHGLLTVTACMQKTL